MQYFVLLTWTTFEVGDHHRAYIPAMLYAWRALVAGLFMVLLIHFTGVKGFCGCRHTVFNAAVFAVEPLVVRAIRKFSDRATLCNSQWHIAGGIAERTLAIIGDISMGIIGHRIVSAAAHRF